MEAFQRFAGLVIWATVLTGVIGEGIKKAIEHWMFKGSDKAEIESLFGRLDLIAPALAAAGLLILIAGLYERRQLENVIPGRAIDRFIGRGTVSLWDG